MPFSVIQTIPGHSSRDCTCLFPVGSLGIFILVSFGEKQDPVCQVRPCHVIRGQGHRTVFVHFYSSDTARESAAEAQGKWQQRTTEEYQPTGRKFSEASPRETLSILAQPQLYLKGTLLESVGQDERNNEAWLKC